MEVDILITKGRVIDPQNAVDDFVDVAIKDGKIAAVGKNLNVTANSTYDATGCIVTPGWIDAHVHCYQHATPLGVNPDDTCLQRGVTTVIDAGSAGASTFMGLRKFIIDQSKTQVKCLLHIALHGLAASGCAGGAVGGESDTLAILDEDACVKCIQDNRDVIVGVKVRLSATVCDKGRLEEEAYRRALSAARRCKVPLMVHHINSTIPTQKDKDSDLGCPGDLAAGDIYTHTYHPYQASIIDPVTRKIFDDVIHARSRGVLFDLGHGAGAFNWTVAEIAAKQNFWPDLLGSDLHTVSQYGPVYDLATVLTKCLHIGMPLCDIIKAVTSSPARAYGLDSIGAFTTGNVADVTVMKIVDCDVSMEDSTGLSRNIKKRIIPVSVWRSGIPFPVRLPEVWPSKESVTQSLNNLNAVIIHEKV